MLRIEAPGNIIKDRLLLDDQDTFKGDVAAYPDGPVMLTVERFTGKKTKKQQGYYWSTLVPHTLYILRDLCGYSEYQTTERAHEFLKYAFNPVYMPDPEDPEKPLRLPGTTRKMSKERKMEYIDNIIMWAWDKFNYTMPPPKKGEKKYAFD